MEKSAELQTVSAMGALRDETWLLRWSSLLYSIFWFAEPIHRHSMTVWVEFLAFYGLFLTGYLRVLCGRRTEQRIWLAVLFLLGYVYYPFNPNAGGEFVFAVVVSSFFLRQGSTATAFRLFAAILAAQTLGLFLETKLLHLPWDIAKSVVFFMVVIGFSNFTYARQVVISRQLRQANEEIERLTQQAERERIARDLHDLLGHTLTVIAVKSDVANRLFALNPKLAHSEIAEVESTARQALREVREAVSGYRSEGIMAGVERARRVLNSAGVQLLTELEAVVLSDAESELFCFILREAVTNIIRHAAATECHLRLSRNNLVRLTIEDNGSGTMGGEGNGIRGMRERLGEVNGRLLVERSSWGGVCVLAELPGAFAEFSADPFTAEANTRKKAGNA